MGDNQLQISTATKARNGTLGDSLVAARKGRGISRDLAVQQTHIPAHYVQMLEDNDYGHIPDQMYLLPFLRRYAIFLDIDPHQTAMRFVGEVQHLENNPLPIGVVQPVAQSRRYRQCNWTNPVIFGALIAVIIGAYAVQSRQSDADVVTEPKLQSSQDTIAPSSSFAWSQTTESPKPAQFTKADSISESKSGTVHYTPLSVTTRTRPAKRESYRASIRKMRISQH